MTSRLDDPAYLRTHIYRKPRAHEVDLARKGDVAEVIRDHCVQETGLLLEVVGDPHLSMARCNWCGQYVEVRLVEVFATYGPWLKVPGPWFYPVEWLKRLDPRQPVQFQRIAKYRQTLATPQQWT